MKFKETIGCMTESYYHVRNVFHSECSFYICLNVKELRCDVRSLSEQYSQGKTVFYSIQYKNLLKYN